VVIALSWFFDELSYDSNCGLFVALFSLSSLGSFSIDFAIQLSVAIALSIMFLLGVFLGRISRRMFFHGVKTLFVGLVLMLILLVLKAI
jgi:hypothetical protein